MKITMCGAAGEVTGSGYLVQTDRARVLVDFGMFQGSPEEESRNGDLGPVEPSKIDTVVLTHAHIDHCGRLPLLRKHGFARTIYATPATVDFAHLLLSDSANIQEGDALRENRRRERSGQDPVAPLYTKADAEATFPLFRALPMGEIREVAPGITIRFHEAGHIPGSASVEMTVRQNGSAKTIVFSGDLGPKNIPLMNDPTPAVRADLIFLESTYGDRDHRPIDGTVAELKQHLTTAAWEKQKLLMPAFAVGRTQLLLFYLAELRRDSTLPDVPVYLDSPMAVKATQLYIKHLKTLDDEARRMAAEGVFARELASLRFIESADESRALNSRWDPCVVIAASGMCEGGRIVHHLKHNLWKKGVVVLIAGYQGRGTLGRRLVDGARTVRIHGEDIAVRATIATLGGFSAHAGQTELVGWLAAAADTRPRVVLTHGEDPQRGALASKLRERYGLTSELPSRCDEIVL